uniref:Ig-like domain-containing protein n=1 Tax=Cyanoderma ruficeps TaxID=181631 RepID=A0A8C3QID4_9PASS
MEIPLGLEVVEVLGLMLMGAVPTGLVVTPQEPVVAFGGSTELNCSLACPGGKVEWRGLDTALGTISSFSTHSILHIRHATVATEGMKICQGKCQGQEYQKTATLKVYGKHSPARPSLPPSTALHLQGSPFPPAVLPKITLVLRVSARRGWNPQPACTSSTEANPHGPALLGIALRLGLQRGHLWPRHHCVFAAVMEQPPAVVTSTGSPSTARPVATTALPPGLSVPKGDPTTAWEPNTGTTPDLAAVTNTLSTEPSVPQDLTAGSPTAPVATTTPPGSGPGTGPSVGTTPACSLRIRSLPPTGTRGRALRIECHAQCTGNATVGWLRTPAALSQYREESAGSSSALRLDRAEPWHQGHYQCVLLGHRAQVVSLEVMVVDGE